MAGALRKTMVYLGLAEDDDYDDDAYDEYDDAAERRTGGRAVGARDAAGHAGHGAAVTPLPQRPLARVVPARRRGELHRITTIHPRTYNEAKTIGETSARAPR